MSNLSETPEHRLQYLWINPIRAGKNYYSGCSTSAACLKKMSASTTLSDAEARKLRTDSVRKWREHKRLLNAVANIPDPHLLTQEVSSRWVDGQWKRSPMLRNRRRSWVLKIQRRGYGACIRLRITRCHQEIAYQLGAWFTKPLKRRD